MELKPGYKQTEVGVIPTEWEPRPFLSVVRPATGQVSPKQEPYRSMILVAPDHIEGETGRLLEKRTASVQRAISGKYLFKPGDIVYSKIRPYLRKAVLADFQGLCSADMYPLTPAKDVCSAFVFAVLLGHRFSTFAETVSVRSGIPKINREELAQYTLALPPLPEQRAIAIALSAADALIDGLDRLIGKKRDLKQAAMHQLLTGRRRLPGFQGRWEMRTLRDVCSSITDGTHFTPRYVDTGIPFYSVENVTADNFTDTKFISLKEHSQLIKRCRPARGDILLTRIGSLGDTKLIEWDAEASIYVSLALLKVKGCVDPRFVYCYTKCRQFVLDIEARSLINAAPKKINMGDIGGVPIPVPPSAEQTAIATVFFDMDAEIAALERRRDKTRALKQGMMQELLTGRTRLV